MKQRVYIETTIPSYYYKIRDDSEAIAKREWTKHWWDEESYNYELVVSTAVIDELEHGNYPTKKTTLKLIEDLQVLKVVDEILDIVNEYIFHKLMPKDPV